MAGRYLKTCFTPEVLAAQAHYYGRAQNIPPQPGRDPLTDEERVFIEARDSFYMATISENCWPYMQHRGGAPGFLRVVSPMQPAFADYKGNRQLLTTGNTPRTPNGATAPSSCTAGPKSSSSSSANGRRSMTIA